MKKNKSTCPVIFMIICICFIAGIIAGSLAEVLTENSFFIHNTAANEILPQKCSFYIMFIKNIKFGIILLALSFISIGIPIIMSIFVLNGIFYGYVFSYIISANGFNGFKEFIVNVLPYSVIRLTPLIFTGCFSSMLIMRRFFKEHSSKAYLKRESEKTKLEIAIVFFALCIIVFISCTFEMKINLPSVFYQ